MFVRIWCLRAKNTRSEAIQKQKLCACIDLCSVNSLCIGKIRISNLPSKQNRNQILENFTQTQIKQNIFIIYMCKYHSFWKNNIHSHNDKWKDKMPNIMLINVQQLIMESDRSEIRIILKLWIFRIWNDSVFGAGLKEWNESMIPYFHWQQ